MSSTFTNGVAESVPLLRSSLAFVCGNPLTHCYLHTSFSFRQGTLDGLSLPYRQLPLGILTATLVVGHALVAQTQSKKARGQNISRRHWGGPKTSMINIDPGLLVVEVSKGREDGSAYCIRAFSSAHSHNMLGAGNAYMQMP